MRRTSVEPVVRGARVILNRSTLPFDANGPWYTSGLRLGTPALTTLGMGDEEMREITSVLKLVLANTQAATISKGRSAGEPSKARYRTDAGALEEARARVAGLLGRYPVYPELDLEYLQRTFG